MCGIAGVVATPLTVEHRRALQRMTDALTHRGPDAQGHSVFAGCALGHRRLSIVDLSGGAQPMTTEGGRTGVTFNGEIYGYQDLRRGFPDYRFHTQSDTELILATYQRYGPDSAKHLPGMFAFAIWDESKQELLCARDRFGEKPLYFASGRSGEFIFASEIKSILASELIDPELDRAAIARYLQRQCVGTDQSIYANIRSLPPAHCLRYRNGQVELSRYWSLPELDDDIDIDEAAERFGSLLRDAVGRQLIADVPVGAFLSGGLDSTTICQVASGLVEDLRTFSFDFEGDHSEIGYARAAASAYHTRHEELAAGSANLAALITLMQRVYDEPFGDTSAIPTYLLAREARRHVKVVLTGDGGDELFGGYTWYKPLLWMQREGRVGLLRWTAARILNRLCNAAGVPGAAARELRIIGLAYGRQYESPLAAHRSQMSFFTRLELDQIEASPGLVDAGNAVASSGSMDDVIRQDIQDYMPADILTKIDRASMAHGLELRAPFLDVEFASFCLSLPYRLKVSTNEDKIILRRAFAAQWPEAIRGRTKQGFGAPLARWFKNQAVLELEGRYLRDPAAPIYDHISYGGAQALLRQGKLMQRWTLLVLGVWLAQAQANVTGIEQNQASGTHVELSTAPVAS